MDVAWVAGQRVSGIVTEHNPWGLGVMLDDRGLTVTVDLLYIGDDPLDANPDRWPEIGTRVHGVIQGETPNGQVRMSLRLSDSA